MNAADVIGYAFDGETYCIDCTIRGRGGWPEECKCKTEDLDENEVCANNCHGHGPNAIFASDEQAEELTCDFCWVSLIEATL